MPGLPDSTVDLLVARALALALSGADERAASRRLRSLAGGEAVLLRLARGRCTSPRRELGAPQARAAVLLAAAETDGGGR